VKRVIERSQEKRHIIESMVVSHFSQYPDSDKAIIEIREDKATRSVKQNKLYWLWLKVIDDETGMPKLDYLEDGKWHKGLHTRFKCDHIDKEFYDDGSMKIPSTKKLKIKGFTEYLERIDRAMIELGIILPHPNDLYWEAMGVKAP